MVSLFLPSTIDVAGFHLLGTIDIVLIILLMVALFAYIERASNDLLVEKRSSDASYLRLEAYSALETTLAVLEDFRQTNGSLKSPAEGWSDPLTFAGYEPPEGTKVEVTFVDESGKFSLPNVTQSTLVNLFKSWELSQSTAETLPATWPHGRQECGSG